MMSSPSGSYPSTTATAAAVAGDDADAEDGLPNDNVRIIGSISNNDDNNNNNNNKINKDRSQKLYELSTEERERGIQDLHGVSDLPIEDSIQLEECLQEFKKELLDVTAPPPAAPAAVSNSSSSSSKGNTAAVIDGVDDEANNNLYIADDRELIKYLRAENFDPKKAKERYLRFQEKQITLFGKAGKLTLQDLGEDDIKFLQSGFIQLLPKRDRAGRAVMICIGSLKYQLQTPLLSDVGIYFISFVLFCLLVCMSFF